jgi:hypothetical protein
VRDVRAADGIQSSPLVSESQQRWQRDHDAVTRANPWLDPNTLITKDERGVVSTRPRTDGGTNGVPQPEGQQPQPGPATVADGRLKIGDLELSEADVKGLMERKSLEDSRRAQMPTTAEAYSLDLPSDFVLPPGVAEWAWNLNNPVAAAQLQAAKEFAFSHGLDQGAFSKMIALHASNEIAEQHRYQTAVKAEFDKLGPNINARVDAVKTWLASQVGEKGMQAITKTMVLADQVHAYERLMSAFVTQGVSGSPGAARDGAHNQPAKVDQATYDKMSYSEKQAYAARFAQPHEARDEVRRIMFP